MIPADDLPALPESDGYVAITPSGSVIVPPHEFGKSDAVYKVFTANQMRAYALAARTERDAEIERLRAALSAAQRLQAAYKVAADVSEPVDSGLDERRYRLVADAEIEFSVPDGYERETLKAGTCVWLARWTNDQLEAARRNAQELHRKLNQSRPSPDPPDPAPLAAQGVEGDPHHER